MAKVLRSAIANAQQKEGFGGDVDRLFVSACYANQGPVAKRIRPAPMGRAFRVLKRTAHLTVQVSERAVEIAPITAPAAEDKTAKKTAPARPARKTAGTARASPSRRTDIRPETLFGVLLEHVFYRW